MSWAEDIVTRRGKHNVSYNSLKSSDLGEKQTWNYTLILKWNLKKPIENKRANGLGHRVNIYVSINNDMRRIDISL